MHISRLFFVVAILAFFAVPSSVMAQTGRIVGTVVDAGNGDSLPGANVVIEGTSIGAAADIEGDFAIADRICSTACLAKKHTARR